MLPIIQQRQSPQRKHAKLAKDDGTPRREVDFEVMDVSQIEAKGCTHNRGDGHGMAHNHDWTVECAFAQLIDNWPGAAL